MKARDEARLRTIRSMLTAFVNELVATGKKPQDTLDDADALAVIKRLAKQRRESILAYESNRRPELAAPEKEELAILESYLPTLLSRAEIRPVVEAKMKELGLADKSERGKLIGAVMKELSGRADGADVKAVVEELFL
jgi:uncharacterized protein YqeY